MAVGPQQGVAYGISIVLWDAANPGKFLRNHSLQAGDIVVQTDAGTPANISTLPVETPAGSGSYIGQISSAQMGSGGPAAGSKIHVIAEDQTDPIAWTSFDFNLDAEPVTLIEDAVWDAVQASHVDAGSTGAALNAAGSAGDPWVTALPGAYGAGSAGKLVGDNLNATVSSRATQTSVDAVQADTDNLQTRLPAALVSGRIDASVGAVAANTLTAAALATDAVAEIQAGLSTLDAAGVRAAVGLATANLDTQLDGLPTNAELATALASADDAVLAAIAALNNLSQANIRTAIGMTAANLDAQLTDLPTNAELTAALAAADDALLAVVNAIKAKTDSLTFTVASVVDANVQRINDVVITGNGSSTPFGV